MSHRARKSEVVLILSFLAIIFIVPAGQACVELWRGQRVRFTDLFRYRPTEANLLRYEKGLEDASVFKQSAR